MPQDKLKLNSEEKVLQLGQLGIRSAASTYHATEGIYIHISRGKMEIESGNHTQRNCTDFPNTGVRICSRYLKPRIGSCHDRCKYGMHDTCEVKLHIHLSKRIKPMPCQGRIIQNPIISIERENESSTTSKFQSDEKVERLGSHFAISSRKKASITLRRVLRPAERTDISVDHGKSRDFHSNIKISPLESGGRVGTKRSSRFIKIRRGPNCSLVFPGSSSSRRKIDATKTIVKIYPMQKSNVLAFSSSSPRFYMKRSSSLCAKKCNYLKTACCRKNRLNYTENDGKQCSNGTVTEKTEYSSKSAARDETMRSTRNVDINGYSSQSPSSSSKWKRNKKSETVTQTGRLPSSLKIKALSHTQSRITAIHSSSLKSSSSDRSSPRDIQNAVRNHATGSYLLSGKKNLRRYKSGVHKSRPSPSTSQPSLRKYFRNTTTQKGPQINGSYCSSFSASRSSSVSAHDEYSDAVTEPGGTNIKVEQKGKDRNIPEIDLERNPPRKLRFRRGKVIEPQAENYAPRKLKFSRGKVHVKNISGKGDARWRNLRKVIKGELSATNTDSTKTALRQQVVTSNKVSESLFNDVIEETASKLVEARKSKVKALVGAFETVISLQDKKTEVSASDPE